MVEGGDRPGLGEEAIERGPIVGDRAGDDLQGHAAIHRHVLGEEDGTHAAFAQPLDELVFAQVKLCSLAQGQERAGLPAADELCTDQDLGQGGRLGRTERRDAGLDKLFELSSLLFSSAKQIFVHGANGHDFPRGALPPGGALRRPSSRLVSTSTLPENGFGHQERPPSSGRIFG